MGKRKGRKDAARPRTPGRLVYEDWVYGVHVRGYQYDTPEICFLVYCRCWGGATVATTHFVREWWDNLMAEKKGEIQRSYVQKALQSKAPQGKGSLASDSALAATCPALHEFLTLSVLPDGTTRTPSTLCFFSDGGLWKAVLNEKDLGLCLWATGESLPQLWEELEARLTAPVVDWRAARVLGPAKAPVKGVDKRRR